MNITRQSKYFTPLVVEGSISYLKFKSLFLLYDGAISLRYSKYSFRENVLLHVLMKCVYAKMLLNSM